MRIKVAWVVPTNCGPASPKLSRQKFSNNEVFEHPVASEANARSAIGEMRNGFEGDGGDGGTSERRLSFAANLIVDQHREAVAENTRA